MSTLDGTVVTCFGCCPPTNTSITPGRISHCVVQSCMLVDVIVNVSWREGGEGMGGGREGETEGGKEGGREGVGDRGRDGGGKNIGKEKPKEKRRKGEGVRASRKRGNDSHNSSTLKHRA